jgi:CcmD family protein
MKKNALKFILPALLVAFALPVSAQDGMEEYFFESGKIKVVIAVAMVVLTGIFIYLFALGRKVSKLEKRIEEGKK